MNIFNETIGDLKRSISKNKNLAQFIQKYRHYLITLIFTSANYREAVTLDDGDSLNDVLENHGYLPTNLADSLKKNGLIRYYKKYRKVPSWILSNTSNLHISPKNNDEKYQFFLSISDDNYDQMYQRHTFVFDKLIEKQMDYRAQVFGDGIYFKVGKSNVLDKFMGLTEEGDLDLASLNTTMFEYTDDGPYRLSCWFISFNQKFKKNEQGDNGQKDGSGSNGGGSDDMTPTDGNGGGDGGKGEGAQKDGGNSSSDEEMPMKKNVSHNKNVLEQINQNVLNKSSSHHQQQDDEKSSDSKKRKQTINNSELDQDSKRKKKTKRSSKVRRTIDGTENNRNEVLLLLPPSAPLSRDDATAAANKANDNRIKKINNDAVSEFLNNFMDQ